MDFYLQGGFLDMVLLGQREPAYLMLWIFENSPPWQVHTFPPTRKARECLFHHSSSRESVASHWIFSTLTGKKVRFSYKLQADFFPIFKCHLRTFPVNCLLVCLPFVSEGFFPNFFSSQLLRIHILRRWALCDLNCKYFLPVCHLSFLNYYLFVICLWLC